MPSIPTIRAMAVAVAALAFAIPAFAAGEHDHQHGHEDDHGGFAAGEPAAADQADRTIRITADEYRYEPEKVTVARGAVVRFVITNRGSQKHSFVIGTPAEQKAHEKEMQGMAERGGGMDHDDPNAVTVAPGESEPLTWRFSEDSTVRYACHIPGHYQAGMVGTVQIN
ncbi:MAG: plastocyanin/azurin family copper-binding protein [Thiohalorhabdaceae bacterium]